MVRYLHFTPEYVLNMSPVQVDGYSKAVMRILKMENGTSDTDNTDNTSMKDIPTTSKEKSYKGVDGSRDTLIPDEKLKTIIDKRQEALSKKDGKPHKMSFLDLAKTGAFAVKQ